MILPPPIITYRRVSLPSDGISDGMANLVTRGNHMYRQGQESLWRYFFDIILLIMMGKYLPREAEFGQTV